MDLRPRRICPLPPKQIPVHKMSAHSSKMTYRIDCDNQQKMYDTLAEAVKAAYDLRETMRYCGFTFETNYDEPMLISKPKDYWTVWMLGETLFPNGSTQRLTIRGARPMKCVCCMDEF